jgi:voltage-gated potassium channel
MATPRPVITKPSRSADPEGAPDAGSARGRLHQVVFESDTAAGRAFDIALIALILLSVAAVSLETVRGLPPALYRTLRASEWTLTAIFTVEYLLRLIAVRRPLAYAASFFGVIDLLAILPTYVSLLVPGAHVLLAVRILRLLRVFRVLKLARFLSEANVLGRALRASLRKIIVFLLTVSTLVVIIGTLMYVVEGPAHGFTSIPLSMYWAVVTLTTVGYGDISPQTALGQALASLVMILGYGIIAVPTGIVTAELTAGGRTAAVSGQSCPACGTEGHEADARFCRRCGAAL